MNFKFFDSCDDFLQYYFELGLDTQFELFLEQTEKDENYLNDEWITWCAVEYETEDGVIPMALIGFREEEEFDSNHISSFEVNINYRSMGFGTMVLKEFIKLYCDKPFVTLYAEPKNNDFYVKLGFEKDPSINKNFYILENGIN